LTVLVFPYTILYIRCTGLYYLFVYLKSFKELLFLFAIVSESGCKGKRFYRNHQMFSKVFFEKVFFRNFHKRRTIHPPRVLSVLAPLAPLR